MNKIGLLTTGVLGAFATLTVLAQFNKLPKVFENKNDRGN